MNTTSQYLRGYTLIELLVTMAIILIILPVLYLSIDSIYKTHARTLARALALSSATSDLQEVVRDIRSAVYGEDGALPLVTIGTSTLVLYTDTDLDGRIERVRYTLSGTTIQKGVIEPTSTSSYPAVSETIDNFSPNIMNNSTNTNVFTYYTATGTPITSQASVLDVRRIMVTFNAQAVMRQEIGTISLRSSSAIRNLKDTY